jgi:hypothetical protein
MTPPRGPRLLLPDGNAPPKKSWRQRIKEKKLGLRLDRPPPDDEPNLAPRGLIPAAARYLPPRFAWELDRWPRWGRLRYRAGVAVNWDKEVGDRFWRPGPR